MNTRQMKIDPSLREDQVGGLGQGGADAAVWGQGRAEVGLGVERPGWPGRGPRLCVSAW